MKIRILGNSPHLAVKGFKQGDIVEVIEDEKNCVSTIIELVKKDGNARIDHMDDVCVPAIDLNGDMSSMWLFHTFDRFSDENTFYEEYEDEN